MKPMLPSMELLGSSKIEIHYQRSPFAEMYHITSSNDAVAILRQYINPKQMDLRESFWVILLSNANRVLGISEVSTGSTLYTQVNPKYIFQLALLTNAVGLIACHVHPSGNVKLSESDIRTTKRLKKLGKLMEVTLLDHIIITSESYLSFAAENYL